MLVSLVPLAVLVSDRLEAAPLTLTSWRL